jgi:hypothetical protein
LRKLADQRITRRRKFRVHLVTHVITSLRVVLVWAITEYDNAGGWPTALRTGRMRHDWDPWIRPPASRSPVTATAAHDRNCDLADCECGRHRLGTYGC